MNLSQDNQISINDHQIKKEKKLNKKDKHKKKHHRYSDDEYDHSNKKIIKRERDQ
jgi:hypothetical protein